MAAEKKHARARHKLPVPGGERTEQEAAINSDRVSSDELLARVVVELVRMRMRHRALIKNLKNGDFDWETYKSHIESVEEEDAEALFHLLIMKWDAFKEQYGNWMTEDFAEYGFKRSRSERLPETKALPNSEDVKA